MICNRGHIFRLFLFIFTIPILTLVHFIQNRNSHVDTGISTMSRRRFMPLVLFVIFNWIIYLMCSDKSLRREKSISLEKQDENYKVCHLQDYNYKKHTNKTALQTKMINSSIKGTANLPAVQPTPMPVPPPHAINRSPYGNVSIIRDCKYWTLPQKWSNSDLTLRKLGMKFELKDCTASKDVSKNLEIRRYTLERECKALGVKDTYLSLNWTWQPLRYNGSLYLDAGKKVTVCLIPKGGSTTWHKNRHLLTKEKLVSKKIISVHCARHPFTRLVSVYNDLFCRGKLFTCASGGDGSRFDGFLYGLWIPILISSGRLKMNNAFSKEIMNIYPIKGYSYRKMTPLGNMANMELMNAVESCYSSSKKDILAKYKGVVVSFEDFINHIFWTYEHGVADHTWNPQTNLCDACRRPYTHVLHLENYDQEIPHIFKVIGFKNIHNFPAYNVRSKDGTNEFINYYYDIPLKMFVRLVKFYHYDFKILGYSL